MKKLLTAFRALHFALFKSFASSRSINSGMGPMSEGNPSGWFH